MQCPKHNLKVCADFSCEFDRLIHDLGSYPNRGLNMQMSEASPLSTSPHLRHDMYAYYVLEYTCRTGMACHHFNCFRTLCLFFGGWRLCGNYKERKISPKFFRPKLFLWTSVRHVRAKTLVFFSRILRPFRSFWPDVRRDVRPTTSSLGRLSVSGVISAFFRLWLFECQMHRWVCNHWVFCLLGRDACFCNKTLLANIGRK